MSDISFWNAKGTCWTAPPLMAITYLDICSYNSGINQQTNRVVWRIVSGVIRALSYFLCSYTFQFLYGFQFQDLNFHFSKSTFSNFGLLTLQFDDKERFSIWILNSSCVTFGKMVLLLGFKSDQRIQANCSVVQCDIVLAPKRCLVNHEGSYQSRYATQLTNLTITCYLTGFCHI